ncbi:glycosyltransferase family 2 protein [Bradyrhizobium cenepequi]|uniref:glycosyltransferase family 2 protein n=1 Tax=Bradyrhizobium cenepequi TaxID=2821403 RepID=UPI001CE39D67|nr:glycosyltransferase family 2 protein [Bradyrhizobium cenepequi]MCA6112702.1 glycosyltransferase family 2 protein [Bradyrhizobium cenepequi]
MSDELAEPAAPPGPLTVSAIIPCLDEEVAIGPVVVSVLAQGVNEIIVVDGGSRDRTVERLEAAGARVIVEPRRGYGRAIQAGIAAVREDADILVFFGGDGSDPTEFIAALVSPIVAGDAIFVLGSRVRGSREAGSLAPQQVVAGYVGGGCCCVWFMVQGLPICRRFAPFGAMNSNGSA